MGLVAASPRLSSRLFLSSCDGFSRVLAGSVLGTAGVRALSLCLFLLYLFAIVLVMCLSLLNLRKLCLEEA